jgi:hypothetical protein
MSTNSNWTDDDKPIPEDDAIKQAHPVRSGRHDLYAEAQRLVSAKRSKYALVELVNWLLHRVEKTKTDERAACAAAAVCVRHDVGLGGPAAWAADECIRRIQLRGERSDEPRPGGGSRFTAPVDGERGT